MKGYDIKMDFDSQNLIDIFSNFYIKNHIKEVELGKDFLIYNLVNTNRITFMDQTKFVIQHFVNEGILKIRAFWIFNLHKISKIRGILTESRIFAQLPKYPKETDLENIIMSYTYENINPILDVEVKRKFPIQLTLNGYSKTSILDLYIKEYQFAIVKDNHTFEELFNMLLIDKLILCVISRVPPIIDENCVYAYIIYKKDEFCPKIMNYIQDTNEKDMKRMKEIVEKIEI